MLNFRNDEISQKQNVSNASLTIADYTLLAKQLNSLFHNETNPLIIMSNTAAFLYENLNAVNWVGFYLYNKPQKMLTLGPFQGRVACTRIPLGKGVCGTAMATQQVQRVPNVHEFSGHIACDSASQSEIVYPINIEITNIEITPNDADSLTESCPIGVLDIDSPLLDRFSELDELGIQLLVDEISNALSRTNCVALLNLLS